MSELLGNFPWRPVISMGDGRGGYGTARHEGRKRGWLRSQGVVA